MKKKVADQVEVQYPFDQYHRAYKCDKCHQLLRYSAIHEKIYVVSELSDFEILHVNHECVKNLSKQIRNNKK